MQSKLTVLLLTACILLFTQVQAACVCDPADTGCLQKCVTDGQSCISNCKGDTNCYNNCISSHWPGQSDSSRSTTASAGTTTATTTSATTATSAAVTTSAVPTSINSAASSVVSSIESVASSVVSAASSSVASVLSSASSAASAAITSAASFTPTPPTSSVAPSQTSGGSKPFLVPAVAIGVAMVTVVIQFFFLARMGAALFH